MTFQPIFPLWIVIPVFIAVLAGLAWLEMHRSAPWRTARLTALTLGLAAMLGLTLQPLRESTQIASPLLLLTKGFERETVDSLLQAHPDWKIIRTLDAADYPKSSVLEDLVELSGLGRRVAAIAGEGLPTYAFEYLEQQGFEYFPAVETTGFRDLQLDLYTEGQVNELQGTYYLKEGGLSFLLQGPEGAVDSVALKGIGDQSFSLAFTPKEAGLWEYQLQVKDSTGNVLRQNILPLVVQAEKKLRILILQAFPAFEIRYLKDFLTDRGHAVAVRTQVSRNDFRTEYANLPSLNLNRLTADLLEGFDLMIADAAAFDQFSRGALNTLNDAVENGLGFLGLITAESSAFRSWLGLADISAETDTVRLNSQLTVSVYPVRTQRNREWYPIQRTLSGGNTAAYYYQGKGKVGFQNVRESYAYLLRGDSLTYASLWMPMLEGTSRELYPEYTIELLNDPPVYIGEPLDFRVTTGQELPTVYADSIVVPMLEDAVLDEVWYGRTWPAERGWHSISVGEERLDYYVFNPDQWPDLAVAKHRKRTAIEAGKGNALTADGLEMISLEPVSRIWFYLLFLLSAGFLWLVPKL